MHYITSFAVRLPVLQVKGVVADWLVTGRAQEAAHVPGLLRALITSAGKAGTRDTRHTNAPIEG